MNPVSVLIASYLEPEHVKRMASVRGVELVYEPDLLPQPRYKCDHVGKPLQRTAQEEERWQTLLGRAEVMFDFDHTHLDRLTELAPHVRWIQSTSAGIGQLLLRTGLINSAIVFTTASGIHAAPLAQFVVMAILMSAKGAATMARNQASHQWERYCGREIRGATIGIIGLGQVGREVARCCKTLGLRVVATKRTPSVIDAEGVDLMVPISQISTVIREADFLVLACPHTPETEGLIGEPELRSMKRDAILINIARGAVVNEAALIQELLRGHLGGAALDVFGREPLPPDSPLWDMPNVLVSPHSASTTTSENAKLTDLFLDNLTRYLRGESLINVFDRRRLY